MNRILILLVTFPVLGGSMVAGNRLYRTGRFRQAAEVYANRLRNGDQTPVVRYNLGTSLLRLSRWDQAREQLESAADGGAAPELRQRAHYNAGNADLMPAFLDKLPKEKKAEVLHRAIDRYKQALRLRPGDVDAKWNLELALRLLDKEPQGGGGGASQDQGGGGGADQQEKGGQAPQPTPGSGGNATPQISREAAERILAGAAQEEAAAQSSSLRRGRAERKVARDW